MEKPRRTDTPEQNFMMLDRNVVAVSPSTTYRVLKTAGRIQRWNHTPSKKGTGFVQPLRPHEHWHVEVSHINRAGTFFYLYSALDGCSRFIVHNDRCLKADCIRPGVPLDLEQARRLLAGFIEHYNTVRLHSAIGHITPQDKLLGREMAIFATREQTLAKARENRKINRLQPPAHSATPPALFSICR
jgi:transposase InsO family protein